MAQTITASQILADLQSGLTRKDIGEKYGLNGKQVAALFKNPSLKHKKTIKEKGTAFIFVDDVAGEQAAAQTTAQAVEETATTEIVEETVFAQTATVAEEVEEQEAEEEAVEDEAAPVTSDERSMWGEEN